MSWQEEHKEKFKLSEFYRENSELWDKEKKKKR